MSARYEIRVMGVLPSGTFPAFETRLACAAPAQTQICVLLPDQEALPALITRLEELGVQVLGLRRLPAGRDARR